MAGGSGRQRDYRRGHLACRKCLVLVPPYFVGSDGLGAFGEDDFRVHIELAQFLRQHEFTALLRCTDRGAPGVLLEARFRLADRGGLVRHVAQLRGNGGGGIYRRRGVGNAYVMVLEKRLGRIVAIKLADLRGRLKDRKEPQSVAAQKRDAIDQQRHLAQRLELVQ